MFSANFDNVDVKDIGRKSLLKSAMFLALRMGGTSAIFHPFGTLHSRKDVFNISVIAGAMQNIREALENPVVELIWTTSFGNSDCT